MGGSFRPRPELYAAGHEPLFLLRALAALGDAKVSFAPLPEIVFADHDPSDSLLSWSVTLETDQTETAIRDVFEFAEGLCTLDVSEAASDADVPAPSAPPPVRCRRRAAQDLRRQSLTESGRRRKHRGVRRRPRISGTEGRKIRRHRPR